MFAIGVWVLTPSENVQLAAIRQELLEEIAGLRSEIQPAVNFYNSLLRFGEAIADAGRFLKWGVGVGAGVATIFGALRLFDVL